ncbi:MAG: PEP-CTERM sorting domain-containing protein [Planctomycetaceae bacterium]|nr:PEP-CTERM sorting domain-containing protein [Planctomycetaceae bacterium]
MKKFIVLSLAWLLFSGAAHAGVEFVGVDGVQTNYTASSGVFLMNGNGLVATIGYDDDSQGFLFPVGFTLNTTFDSGTHFAGGTFQLTDASASIILSGNVLFVDFVSAGSSLDGEGQAQVLVSNLAGYPQGLSDIVSLTFRLTPAFTDFSQDYSGKTKINFLVPEPATMLLLAVGGLMLRKRR